MIGARRSLGALDDLQAGVVRAAGHPHATALFVRLADAASGRSLVRSLLPEVTAERAGPRPAVVRTVALSADGLRRLGVDEATIVRFGAAFAAGQRRRAAQLGDAGAGSGTPTHWLDAYTAGDIHVLLWLHAAERTHLEDARGRWLELVARAGATAVHEVAGSIADGAREQFGFADGYGQPLLAGDGRIAGETGLLTARRDRPLAAGEFVLGYADELGVVSPAGRTVLGRNASLLVIRQLHQDVARFRAMVAAAGATVGLPAATMAAKLVGRWTDGTSLIVSPEGPPPPQESAPGAAFDYADDPLGARCPLGAHVRRANPRDTLARSTTRHRIIRRGMPYGPPLPDGAADDGAERGLLFACFQADIERQFEFVQRRWLDDGDLVGRADERDPLAASPGGDGTFLIGGYPPVLVSGLSACVTARGGEYFVLPGLTGLTWLAGR